MISILKCRRFSSKEGGGVASNENHCKVTGRSTYTVFVILVKWKPMMPRFLCRVPSLWSPAETSGHSSLFVQPFSKTRSLCKRGFYFLFNPPTNSFPVPSLPGWSAWSRPQEYQGTFSACYQKQGSYSEKSIIGHSFSCPSEWDNCICHCIYL